MEAQSLVSHQHSWWFSCFSLREKLARSHNRLKTSTGAFHSSRLLTTDNFDFRRVLVVFYSTHSRFKTTKKPALAS